MGKITLVHPAWKRLAEAHEEYQRVWNITDGNEECEKCGADCDCDGGDAWNEVEDARKAVASIRADKKQTSSAKGD